MRKSKFFFLFLCFASSSFAYHSPPPPWFTGSLLVPSGEVYYWGEFNIQSFLYVTTYNGFYDKNWDTQPIPNYITINPQVTGTFGLTSFLDTFFLLQFYNNRTQGQSDTVFGDSQFGFDIQIWHKDAFTYLPSCKLTLKETFPSGPYHKLNPKKKFTDIGGTGSYVTNFSFVFYKQVHLAKDHWLTLTLSVGESFPTKVKLKGINVYGGSAPAPGTVKPGNYFTGIFSFEIGFSKHWAFAMDTQYIHTNQGKIVGFVLPEGQLPNIPLTSSEQISMTPSLEYNFNYHLGIIAGAWITVAGRNSYAFRSGVISFEYTY